MYLYMLRQWSRVLQQLGLTRRSETVWQATGTLGASACLRVPPPGNMLMAMLCPGMSKPNLTVLVVGVLSVMPLFWL